jgi:putative membrane protein
MGLVIRLAISAIALWITTLLISGIRISAGSTAKQVGTLIAVAIIFGVVNAVIRPVVKFIGCAFYVLTLGLIALVVNGAMFLLTSWIAGHLGLPFHVANFWPSAILGALIVGVLSWAMNALVPDRVRSFNHLFQRQTYGTGR